jgi:hypothetical protein
VARPAFIANVAATPARLQPRIVLHHEHAVLYRPRGDCVESHHLVSRRPVHVALGTHANKQGRVAGINIGGGDATFPGVLGTAAADRTCRQSPTHITPRAGIRCRHVVINCRGT